MKPATAILLLTVAAIAVTGGIEFDRVRRDAPCRTANVDPSLSATASSKGMRRNYGVSSTHFRDMSILSTSTLAHPHRRIRLPRLRIGVRIRPLHLPRIESPFRRHPDAVLRKSDARPTVTPANSMPSRVETNHAKEITRSNAAFPKSSQLVPGLFPVAEHPASPRPLRLGIAHTSLGETALTYDLVHRDVDVNPLGIRVKVGEWGGGLMVSKRLGKGNGFDAGPQVNYQAGRTFVGVGYAVRNRVVVGMVGTKF